MVERKKIIKKKKFEVNNDVIDATQRSNEIFHKSQSSCTIKRDSKGSVNLEVKVYDDSAEEAVRRAIFEFKKLTKKI